jgi:hypothetical protein
VGSMPLLPPGCCLQLKSVCCGVPNAPALISNAAVVKSRDLCSAAVGPAVALPPIHKLACDERPADHLQALTRGQSSKERGVCGVDRASRVHHCEWLTGSGLFEGLW